MVIELIRSFIAFDIEDEDIIRNISKVQFMLLETGADIKIVEPKNIHITVRFLGNISPSMIEQVFSEIEKVTFSPFDIEVKGLGAFPNLRHINVIWAGIRKGVNELRTIYYQLEHGLQRLGFRPDNKSFSPHLTIARVRSSRNKDKLVKLIIDLEEHRFGVFKAKCLRLKKSVLTPNGPIYSTLREVCR